MKIFDADKGDFLQGPNGFLQIDRYGYPTNEMGIRIGGIDYSYPDYKRVTPPLSITEHGTYTARLITDAASFPLALILSEYGGEFHGFRHRFPISNYAVSIPILFKSTDPRVGQAMQNWHVRSGQFFALIKARPQGIWTFVTGTPVKVNIDWGTDWIIVPAQ